jgi:hypothetical protein
LSVASDGVLSGTPASGDVGLNAWTVQVTDGMDTNTTVLQIAVASNGDWDNDRIPDTWESQYFGNATNALAFDDPDGDGLNNLYEYGLDGDPTNSADKGTAPIINVIGSVVNYVYPQRNDAVNALLYYPEIADDLNVSVWTNQGYSITGTNVTGGTLNFVTNEISPLSTKTKFIRLIIEQR